MMNDMTMMMYEYDVIGKPIEGELGQSMYIFLAHVLLGIWQGFCVDFWPINNGEFKWVFGDF